MDFMVDRVTEDSFYENLLLGITKIIENRICLSDVRLTRFPPANLLDIRTWEHDNGILLPEEMRAFYLSTNGFQLTYQINSTLINQNDEPLEGGICIHSLSELKRIQLENNYKSGMIDITPENKIFKLASMDNSNSITLIYLHQFAKPNVWLFCEPTNFYFLTCDFTTYFRMAMAHMGIPNWQLIVSMEGLTEWTREIFQLIAPGILREDLKLVEPPDNENFLNVIDPNIFKSSTNNSSVKQSKTNQSKNDKKWHTKKSRQITVNKT